MTSPTPHPRTKVYRIRLTIPKHLRDTTERLYGVRAEFIRSLSTKSLREARHAAPLVVEEFQARLRAAENAFQGRERHLSDREISALCGRWLAKQEARSRDNLPETVREYEAAVDFLSDVLAAEADPDQFSMVDDAECYFRDRGDLEAMLGTTGGDLDADSRRRLIARLAHVKLSHAQDMLKRAETGRWEPTVTSAAFASVPPSSRAAPSTSTVTLDAMLDGWGLDRGWTRNDKPMSRAFYDRQRTMDRLATFMGHRAPRRIGKDDVSRWKAEMQGRKLNAATIRNDMSEMSAIWRWGMAHEMVEANPFTGLLPPKAKRKGRDPRPFTPDEAKAILMASRGETGALRWLPWLLCLTGARLNEVCQATREDVLPVDGVTVLRIHDEGEGRSVKNADSRRMVPIHPSLRREGFLEYVAALPAKSPLWPDMAPDTFGRRSGTAGRKVSRWLKVTLKISDPLVSPNHSWRHTFMDMCRRVVMPLEVRNAITGHSGRYNESAGYGAGMGTLVEIMAEHLARVPAPLD